EKEQKEAWKARKEENRVTEQKTELQCQVQRAPPRHHYDAANLFTMHNNPTSASDQV
ncbi:hypothetical protein PIB30_113089, partial [Stylosanthes scabra]|nr:hypothetical protein [Stylosanthes scabra]